VRPNYINSEDNYAPLIDFESNFETVLFQRVWFS